MLLRGVTGCDAVKPVRVVKDFVVEIVTATGQYIVTRASTLAGALRDAWRKIFPERDPSDPLIRITSEDKLRGEYDGEIWVKLRFPSTDKSGGCELEAKLKKPVLMYRVTVNDPWDIAPENYPPPFRKELKDRGAIEDDSKQ